MLGEQPVTLGERMKLARTNAGLSRAEIAKHFGITVQAVGAWERNKSRPSYEVLAEFAKLTNVTTDWLLGVQKEFPPTILRAAARSQAEALVAKYKDKWVVELAQRLYEDLRRGIPSEAEREDAGK